MRKAEEIKNEITERFGFFPPFFAPAFHSPAILENLWQQTLSAYVENPIPALFKEKLAALIARYCSVPYCLVCHSSTLRPLGMKAKDVLSLLESAPISSHELELKIKQGVEVDGLMFPLNQWPEENSKLEEAILHCSVAVFLHVDNQNCHSWLREVLSQEYYDYLILFIAYNRTCLTWAESHPELSFEADNRAQNHLAPLVEAEPLLSDFFKNYQGKIKAQADQRLRWLTDENRRLIDIELKANQSLRETVSALEEEKEVRQKFVDTLTHDLRTPLAAIKLNLQLVEKLQGQKDKQAPHVARAEKNILRMERMIENLLDASRIRSGQTLQLNLEFCDIEQCLQEVVDEQNLVSGNRIILNNQTDRELKGRCNPEALNRILENLISNAVKYGHENEPITVGLEQKTESVVISVHNFGRALSKNEQSFIFNPFFRVENTKAKGWGIGLTIVKGLVEAHGGEVRIESSENSGTIFSFVIPCLCNSPE